MSRPLALILTLYFLLAAGYGIASPPFETPDENLHYFTAEYSPARAACRPHTIPV